MWYQVSHCPALSPATSRTALRLGSICTGCGPCWRPWSGEDSLPLWKPRDYDAGFAPGGPGRTRAAGLPWRPLETTLSETLLDEITPGLSRPRRAGLTRDREHEILAAAAANGIGSVRSDAIGPS